ncbi:MAG TPA: hypothetical protein VF606_09680, partial [Geminicoccaceae bacterium]
MAQRSYGESNGPAVAVAREPNVVSLERPRRRIFQGRSSAVDAIGRGTPDAAEQDGAVDFLAGLLDMT